MINIAEILKDCPKGTKLYSPLFGDCMFREIDNSSNFKIVVEIENSEPRTFDDFGRYFSGFQNSECMLFPSKDNRDWSKFQVGDKVHPWTIQDAKDGDVIFYDDGWTCIFKCIHGIWYSSYCFITIDGEFHMGYERHAVDSTINGNAHTATKEQCNFLFQKIKEHGYKWNAETKTLEKLIVPKFKVGDEIVRKNGISNSFIVNSVSSDYYGLTLPDRTDIGVLFVSEQDDWELVPPIHKFKVGDKIVKKDIPAECWYVQGVVTDRNSDYFYHIVTTGKIANLHFRDQDEWELAPVPKFKVGDIVKTNSNTLFDYKIVKITDTHYTLESIPGANTYDMFICEDENWKLIPKKFDISTLKAYDKVLVRDTNEQVWVADLFSHALVRPLGNYTFACVGHYPNQCIPYLGNEHLLGTCDDCGEYYKNW
jgi:hypothetical protein